MSRFLLALVLFGGFAPPAAAQSALLRTGDEVRVTSPAATGRFTVENASDDALLLRDAAGLSVAVPVSTVSKLSVSRGQRPRGKGALRGAGIGFGTGAVAGIVIGLASGDDDAAYTFIAFTAEEKAVLAGVVLGGAGAVVGTLIGLAAPGERWQRVHLPRGARAGIGGDGGLRLAYTIRF